MKISIEILLFLVLTGLCFGQHQLIVGTYKAGEQVYTDGKYSDAHSYFNQVATQSADKDLRAKAMYMRALSSYRFKQYESSASEFEEFEKVFPDHPLVHRAGIYAGNAYFLIKNYLNSSQQFAFALLSDDVREQHIAEDALEKLLWGYLPIEHFPSLLDRVDRSVESIVGKIWLKRLKNDGEYARALREGQKLLQRVYEVHDKKQLQIELTEVEDYLKKHLVVAVLVPQSGDYAHYGQDVLTGVRLAFSSIGENVELKVLNSGGDPLTTAEAVDNLLKQTTPLCIIGPITSNEAVAAGAIAGTYKVPLITPSASRDGISALSPYVFQLVASPVKASAFLAQFACDSMDTFAILAPDDQLGHSCAIAIARVVAENNRFLLTAQFYRLGNVDFSQPLTKIREPIVRYYDDNITHIDTTDTAIYECFPDSGCFQKPPDEWLVHIDGLFLPAYYDDIAVILPQIPFMYIDTKVLGSNGWVVNDLRKDKSVKKYLDGSLVTPDDFYVYKDKSSWNNFKRLYKKQYGGSPSRLTALGYDAANLVISGIQHNAVTQELMRDYLSGIYNFAGVAGPITFDENGANTETIILQFIGDELNNVK
ncbi:ABC transporter substrate-binding protein [bacterium]|nr:ABC transporter substrate-binding protein [bacterium]